MNYGGLVLSMQLELPHVAEVAAPKKRGRKPLSAAERRRRREREHAATTHRPRLDFASRHPLHVTLRMRRGVFSLRSRRSYQRLLAVFAGAKERFGCRLVQYSVQGNHIHLLVEAADRIALGRAIKGLGVRIARTLNDMMDRRGHVIAERYHARVLRGPTQVRNVVRYLRENARKHYEGSWGPHPTLKGARMSRHEHVAAFAWERLTFDGPDPYASGPPGEDDRLATPRTWLVRIGWRSIEGRDALAVSTA